MGSNASDVARKNCGFWCFLGVTEMGGVLWFIPMNSPTMEAKMMLRSAQQPTWRRLLIGIRWVSRIPVFFFATQLGESQMMGQKTDKKRKSNDHIWDIYGYISAVQLYQALKKGSQLTTLTCCADVAAVGLHVQKWGWLDPSNGARITACLAKVSRTWMVAMANLLTKKWMT
jgi:hypothetical protein